MINIFLSIFLYLIGTIVSYTVLKNSFTAKDYIFKERVILYTLSFLWPLMWMIIAIMIIIYLIKEDILKNR